MNQVHRKNQPSAVGNLVYVALSMEASADPQVARFKKRMEDSGKGTDKKGGTGVKLNPKM
eukprot:CAMPEP_0201151672 /NCGR_PEP_ID=MMETSP0851-20130426/12545_1 /ASSEMBLY_ACC=CAM_ASM_000631 /TAXON_ID=183588 /ORGANISM="Pseudo-nitzschia fraudulenta, Strain WWA7" /LENGTH=59 /DNA_ID=CAMNT_0047428567 /DNA_START=76 /DNA_END=252 /DNA_ORIENTATION=-